MGLMRFLLPAGVPGEAVRELQRTSVAAGEDSVPSPTQVIINSSEMILSRNVEESGSVLIPWEVNGTGRVMVRTATLMEKEIPYCLLLELARGKINQLRGQAFDWLTGGLLMPPELSEEIHGATLGFARAVCQSPGEAMQRQALSALAEGCDAADHLVRTYINQVFEYRHQNQPRLETALACQFGTTPPGEHTGAALAGILHQVALPFPWNEVEPTEGDFSWEPHDALVLWAEQEGLRVVGGPLVDFSGVRLPSWLWRRQRDLSTLCGYLCDFVERVIRRYRGRITSWQITAASNAAQALAPTDEELLWLTMRLVEAAREVDPALDLVVGIAQPWGEYMASPERTQSPFMFADTLVRSGLKLNALDLEIVMGVHPRGSYCRDLLETSRLLDLFTLLGLPLQVTLGYPSAGTTDPQADSDLSAGAGHWRTGFSPEAQADWAAVFADLALCKPYVRAVQWVHALDGEPHLFPHCGLIDGEGNVKPVVERLRKLRDEHLK